MYILANNEVDWLDILLIGRLLPSLFMCKLYYIRKCKRTTCTYAAADPEQLHFLYMPSQKGKSPPTILTYNLQMASSAPPEAAHGSNILPGNE